jgi:hypothetical protein
LGIKARDVRQMLEAHGVSNVPPGVVRILEVFAEDISVMKQQVFTMAQMQDQFIDTLGHMVNAIGTTQDAVKQIASKEAPDDDGNPTH